MDTWPLDSDPETDSQSRGSRDGDEADDEGLADSDSSSSSSWSELKSPDQSSSDDELEDGDFHEEEFLGILALARAARELYATSGQLSDLEDCIAYLWDALSVAPHDNIARADVLHTLAYDLYIRFQDMSDSGALSIEELNESIHTHRRALRLLPVTHSSRAIYMSRLAIALRARFLHSKRTKDLEECISFHRHALALRPTGHPDRSQSLLNLANAYWTYFEHRGDLGDLDEAVRLDREALELRPPGHPNRVAALNSLATDLGSRFSRTGSIADLNQAIDLQREVLQVSPRNYPDRDVALHNLASYLFLRYNVSHQLDDLETAIHLAEEELVSVLDRPPEFHLMLQILAELYLAHFFQDSEDPRYLKDAIRSYRRCLEYLPDICSHRANAQTRLAYALTMHFRRGKEVADISEAIELLSQALAMYPAGHPCYVNALRALALAYQARFEHLHDRKDLDEALSNYAAAVRNPYGRTQDRYEYAQEWAGVAERYCGDQQQLDAHTCAVALLPRIAYLEKDSRTRSRLLRNMLDVVQNAVSCALAASQPEKVVELMEEGSVIRLFTSLEHPNPLDQLPNHLSQRLLQISHELENGCLFSGQFASLLSGIPFIDRLDLLEDHTISSRQHLVDEFGKLVDAARKIPGFSDFLRPKAFSTLLDGWAYGPIVLLVSSRQCCAGIVIMSASVNAVRLPLSPRSLEQLAAEFKELALVSNEDRYGSLLGQLWREVVSPIIATLKPDNLPGQARPRLWWYPTGAFSSVPLHAAGRYANEVMPVRGAADYVVSSYTPTISILRTASQRSALNLPASVLLASCSSIPSHPPLSAAFKEVKLVRTVVPANLLLHPKNQDENIKCCTTRSAILQLIPRATVLHATCYTTQDYDWPLQTGIELCDGRLNVSDLIRLGLPHAQVAYLGGCHSLATTVFRQDGVILPTAMMIAGFRSVVGTMWNVNYASNSAMTQAMYRALFNTNTPDYSCVPYIVDSTAQDLRGKGASFASWVPFIHIGF